MPARDGKDGLLVGADAQGEPESLYARSLPKAEALQILQKSRAARVVVVLDACFSGRTASGKPLVEGLQPLVVTREEAPVSAKTVLLTAAKGDEFAGPLPGLSRPAFSYLLLGGLRGWADADGDGKVSAAEAGAYAGKVLRVLAQGRTQTPTVEGGKDTLLGEGREAGPPLRKLVLRYGSETEAQEVPAPKKPEPRAPPEVLALRRFVGTFLEEGIAHAGAFSPTAPAMPYRGRKVCDLRSEMLVCRTQMKMGSGPGAVDGVHSSSIVWDGAARVYRITTHSTFGTLTGVARFEGPARFVAQAEVAGQPIKIRFAWDWKDADTATFLAERSISGGPFQRFMEGTLRRAPGG